MAAQFPPQFGQLAVSAQQWQDMLDQLFFPVGPFELIDGWVEVGDSLWKLFKDTRDEKRYKYCDELILGDKILIEPFDEGIDQVIEG